MASSAGTWPHRWSHHPLGSPHTVQLKITERYSMSITLYTATIRWKWILCFLIAFQPSSRHNALSHSISTQGQNRIYIQKGKVDKVTWHVDLHSIITGSQYNDTTFSLLGNFGGTGSMCQQASVSGLSSIVLTRFTTVNQVILQNHHHRTRNTAHWQSLNLWCQGCQDLHWPKVHSIF